MGYAKSVNASGFNLDEFHPLAARKVFPHILYELSIGAIHVQTPDGTYEGGAHRGNNSG